LLHLGTQHPESQIRLEGKRTTANRELIRAESDNTGQVELVHHSDELLHPPPHPIKRCIRLVQCQAHEISRFFQTYPPLLHRYLTSVKQDHDLQLAAWVQRLGELFGQIRISHLFASLRRILACQGEPAKQCRNILVRLRHCESPAIFTLGKLSRRKKKERLSSTARLSKTTISSGTRKIGRIFGLYPVNRHETCFHDVTITPEIQDCPVPRPRRQT
jgi:hypothetical protein